MIENFDLKHSWVLWFHKQNENIWTLDKYQKIIEIKTYYDILTIQKELKNMTAGIFVLMKEGIHPIFEDEKNREGGYWSLKLPKKDVSSYWSKLLFYLCIDRITNSEEDEAKINGLSITPKVNNCIFKIWNSQFKEMNMDSIRKDLDFINYGEMLYAIHS